MESFKIKQHDSGVALKAILQNQNGAVDLTNATVRFISTDYSYQSIIDGMALVQDAVNGEAWYVFEAADTEKSGTFKAEFEATFDDGRTETFPTEGYITVEIIRDLG